MLLGLFAAIIAAPFFWLVPSTHRRDALTLASFAALAVIDPRVPAVVLLVAVGLFALLRCIVRAPSWTGLAVFAGCVALTALFVLNKLTGQELAVLPTQGGLALLGVSYLVLKAAALLIEAARGSVRDFSLREVLAWIVFLPTYSSGPMEDFEHFRDQSPVIDRTRVFAGLERILFGLFKALVVAHQLGEWVDPVVSSPLQHDRGTLLLGLYALSLRFYFDFSGYSDVAIGLGALYGYDIEENFDRPFQRRNLVELWQRWHMTLTRWLRRYLFIPVSRRFLRRLGSAHGALAIAAGQIVAMVFCGLWHGIAWNFVAWGFLQAVALVWVGVLARDIGRRLPNTVVDWWRHSRTGYALSTVLTFNVFAFLSLLVFADVESALSYWRLLLWAS
jgi:D-alanyl-lipoteichoic acid acyltransferase DltB (MBOAT superfamily)